MFKFDWVAQLDENHSFEKKLHQRAGLFVKEQAFGIFISNCKSAAENPARIRTEAFSLQVSRLLIEPVLVLSIY